MLPFFRRQPYARANQSNNHNQIIVAPPPNPENITHSSVAESTADLVVTQIIDQTAMQTQSFRQLTTSMTPVLWSLRSGVTGCMLVHHWKSATP